MTSDDERIALFLDYENLAIGARERSPAARSTSDPSPTRSPSGAASSCGAPTPTGRTSTRTGACSPATRSSSSRSRSGWARSARTRPTSRWRSTRSSCASSATTSRPSCSAPATATSRPLVHKLRELNRRVIGIGVEASTSALLPPACDEFLFYERLEGVEPSGRRARDRARRAAAAPQGHAGRRRAERRAGAPCAPAEEADLDVARDPDARRALAQQRRSRCSASMLKRAHPAQGPDVQRGRHGFRGFGELLRTPRRARRRRGRTRAPRQGDPEVTLPDRRAATRTRRSRCSATTVERLAREGARRTCRA